ncbi:YicC/YloC family endoribonuclease [Anaeromyxobacter paludicola]|uniref:YicC family protein n=1 Tax=Anaeromyxobacter paludicola TaxID=2918171 RepID=A0ABM7X8K0_9BACT|nr:YicC/YloC family endoribonuclease [Anaeromyxobacter paludicola]BDG08150.1 hypothetical protein AMPC_12630 [Anaeromyxobacter paludicola]
MIRSMTGFGAGHGASGGEEIDLEIRSVNHKFCEVKARLPRELAVLELEVIRAVKDRLARGGVEVSIRRGAGRAALTPRVDAGLAAEYLRAFRDVGARLGLPGEVRLEDVLRADGVVSLEERTLDVEAARAAVAAALGGAIDSLTRMREREGEALEKDISSRLALVESFAARVEQLAPRSVEYHRDRIAERVSELTRGFNLDPARLAQEIALFADRIDVAEEVTRLRSHVAQMRGLMAGGDPAGRKMEFLVQEMHREVNTIGSKSQSAEIAAAVVVVKAEIERMREQVANVE